MESMLMEKYSTFKIEDSVTKKFFYVETKTFLQEKQMSFQRIYAHSKTRVIKI